MGQVEQWVEVNLFAELRDQDSILLDVLKPYVEKLRKKGTLVNFHFFREPEIRFRVRLNSPRAKATEKRAVAALARSLQKRGLVSRWRFGNHGERGRMYVGEEDRYGKNGWQVAQDYFRNGSETALRLLALKRDGMLENPLWAKGLGNPWEGGDKNPWKEREDNPLIYNWSRYVHLFTNQLGFDIDEESRLCAKQSERYAEISKGLGIKW
ncbi:MAG TPA: lantibiotic dehydratase C-terminal domain-containing protein [Nitrososphaerales archaeon]|nr:lantibiotic dehydratase C-terminal domain-containing protein [Nitrososphaerales archaeon]